MTHSPADLITGTPRDRPARAWTSGEECSHRQGCRQKATVLLGTVKSPLSPLVLVARRGPCRPGVLARHLHAAHVLGELNTALAFLCLIRLTWGLVSWAADQFLTSLTKDWNNCGAGTTVPVNLQLLISPNYRVSPGRVEETLSRVLSSNESSQSELCQGHLLQEAFLPSFPLPHSPGRAEHSTPPHTHFQAPRPCFREPCSQGWAQVVVRSVPASTATASEGPVP